LALDEETQVGKINKIYAGFVREAFTTADRFGISCNYLIRKNNFMNYKV
jgi:hypothetical protein